MEQGILTKAIRAAEERDAALERLAEVEEELGSCEGALETAEEELSGEFDYGETVSGDWA